MKLATFRRCCVRSLPSSGFSLIVTIALMVVLTVIAVGLLSLATISLKSESIVTAEQHARDNARMALKLAIGRLQECTGQDTRITAPANLVDETNPQLVGVWRSWEGTDHDSTGRPIPPTYSAKGINATSGGRFVDWLVSSADFTIGSNINEAPNLIRTTPGSGTVPLLAKGSLAASDTRQVHVIPTSVSDDGRLAWWVSGENQKARLAQPYEPRSNDPAGFSEMGQSHTITNPGALGLTSLLDDLEPFNPQNTKLKPARKAVTRQSMALLTADASKDPEKAFHDFSTQANGLLTNSATGGWRKDLSLLTERWDNIYSKYPGGKLPLFRFTPNSGSTTQVPKPTTASYEPAQSNLYPWSRYSLLLGSKAPNTYHAASASWASLVSFATSYKNFTTTTEGAKSPFVWDVIASQRTTNITAQHMYKYKHVQRLHPQIAHFQFLVYAQAIEDPARLNQNPKRFQMRLMYVPFFTLWNPYNVTLEHTIPNNQYLGFGWRRSPPGAMAIAAKATYPNPSLVPSNQYRLLTPGNFQVLDRPGNNVNPYDTGLTSNITKGYTNRWVDKRTFGCWLPSGTITFKPGEVKIYSPGLVDPTYGLSGVVRLKEGYNPTGIIGVEFAHLSNLLSTQSYWFLMKTDRVTQPFLDRQPGAGFSLSFGDQGPSPHFGGGSMPTGVGENEFHNITALTTLSDSNDYWPPSEVDEVGYTIGELASVPWTPIFSISFGPRVTIGTGVGTKQNRPTKGMVQNNPLASMVLSNPGSGSSKEHPVNNTFDFAYHSLSIGSTITPNLSTSKGFMATGHQSGDGLSRLIMCNIPLRPMASLVELQGWNPRGNNPYPPFQHNLIGNSDATPLIPMNHVVPSSLDPSSPATNLMHDDAYCTNHLLFDDWFASSIAPLPYSFGRDISKDIYTLYTDFLTGNEQLPNRAYRPILADMRLKQPQITTLSKQMIDDYDGWLKVASHLNVDGMFNVNSTSVEAWKALLGHAKNLEQVAMFGATDIVATSTNKKHVVARGAVASDVEAGAATGFGAQFANASEFTGYRSLSDSQIEDLATKIVEQVRQRGPFLSLSEFVNRQLSSNTNLALAGAVQSAINNLSDDPMASLKNPANMLSQNTMDSNNPKVRNANYEFVEASVGSSAYGAPGWVRQADVLRPIAPILSVRDDTFTIRAYGDHLDKYGKVVAKAWCEAVVLRTRDFCDIADAADSLSPPISPANLNFGRRFQVISFKWLNADEI